MELYYEQNVVNNNIDERIRKTKTLTFAQTIMWVIGVFILVSSAVYITMIWAFMLISVPFFVVAFIINRANKRNNTEYDYVIDDENIKISEIYYRSRRKLKYTIRLRTLESVGVFDSEGYRKVQHNVSKKSLAIVNYDDEKSIVYLYYGSEKGKRIIFIEPDRGFMIALRRAVQAVTLFDKSISDLEKCLAEREAQINSVESLDADDEDDEELEQDEQELQTETSEEDNTADTSGNELEKNE